MPIQFTRGMRVFGGQSGGQVHVAKTLLNVGLVQASDAFHLLLEPVAQFRAQRA